MALKRAEETNLQKNYNKFFRKLPAELCGKPELQCEFEIYLLSAFEKICVRLNSKVRYEMSKIVGKVAFILVFPSTKTIRETWNISDTSKSLYLGQFDWLRRELNPLKTEVKVYGCESNKNGGNIGEIDFIFW